MTWELRHKYHMNPDYQVSFANIVPCNLHEIPAGYTLEHSIAETPEEGLQAWTWTFKPLQTQSQDSVELPDIVPPKQLIGKIDYEIFISYGPMLLGSQTKNIRLSHLIKIDPTLALPAKSSGGPDDPGGPDQK